MTLKNKVRELAFPDTTSMFAPLEKVKTKGALKSMKSTKCTPSMWKRINKMNTMVNSLGTPSVAHKDVSNKKQTTKIPYIDEFPNPLQQCILKIVHVRPNENYAYKTIADLLGQHEELLDNT